MGKAKWQKLDPQMKDKLSAKRMRPRQVECLIHYPFFALRCGANQFRTQAIVGTKAGFIDSSVSDAWINESREISAMIQGLTRSLKSSG